ncbi:hypothetical protein UVI_02022970 [Ustilaginoidea virens]|uniref:Uncharacterized protein n=1 Tax=Ustilaginoidea virens TaxID=1159556 RepID=A0A1B5L476_USTVR|nr:hypothetical protein UVI_02022970 [Ustilaginoidea virens]
MTHVVSNKELLLAGPLPMFVGPESALCKDNEGGIGKSGGPRKPSLDHRKALGGHVE